MKWIEEQKKKLGDEAYKKIEGDLKGNDIYLLDPKDYTPKEKSTELPTTDDKITEMQKTIDDMKSISVISSEIHF